MSSPALPEIPPTHLLIVRSEGGSLGLPAIPGLSVREILDTTELRVRAACGGTGSCGACGVRLLAGEANPPTLAEYTRLSTAERRQDLDRPGPATNQPDARQSRFSRRGLGCPIGTQGTESMILSSRIDSLNSLNDALFWLFSRMLWVAHVGSPGKAKLASWREGAETRSGRCGNGRWRG